MFRSRIPSAFSRYAAPSCGAAAGLSCSTALWGPSRLALPPTAPTSAVAPQSQVRHYSSCRPLWARGAGKPSASSSAGSTASSWADSVQANFTPSVNNNTQGQSTADSLTPQVRSHLVRVYNLLAAGVVSAGLSSAVMIMSPLGRAIPWWLPGIGGLIPLFWLMWAPPKTIQGRLALFFAFTVIEGMALAPIVKMSLVKGVLGSAVILTGAVFGGFSAAAYLAPRASMLALQGPLFGMLMGMIAISILNIFYPTAFAHSIILYGGLALFSMFVAVDTQAMIERARCGAGDHVQDALQMFLNVVNIFVRIAQILGGMRD